MTKHGLCLSGWVLAVLLYSVWPVRTAALDLYISPAGDDACPGTKDKPFASLEAARDAVRQWKIDHSLDEPVTVWLNGGVYHRDKTLLLDERDSGTEAYPIVYRASNDEPVRIIGGLELTLDDFKPVTDTEILERLDPSARGNVLELDLHSKGIDNLERLPDQFSGNAQSPELFYNHRPMTVARWPNDGWATIDTITDPGKPKDQMPPDGLPGTFTYKSDRQQRWSRATELWLHGYWQYDWTDEVRKVLKLDLDKHSITIAPGGHYGLGKGNETPRRYYAFNLLEELTVPGEWVLDHQSAILYFWPPKIEPNTVINLSLLKEPLIKTKNVGWVAFQGITFEVSCVNGIEIVNSTRVEIKRCTLRNIGGTAVVINDGKQNVVAEGELYHCGTGGIALNGGDRTTLTSAGHRAVNNHIYNYSRTVRTYSAAVLLSGVGNIAAHNVIHDAPHLAFLFFGNDHIMEYNVIHHVGLETADAGVIYSGRDWTFRGNMIRYNFLHHNGMKFAPPVMDPEGRVDEFEKKDRHGVHGIYLDDCYSSATVHGNIIHGSQFGVFIGGGRDNVVTNNIMVECKHAVALDARGIVWESRVVQPGGTLYTQLAAVPYQSPTWSEKYPELAVISKYAPPVPIGNIVRDNVFYQCDESIFRMQGWKDVFSQIGEYYETQEDPGFVDAEHDNFQLRNNSLVFEKLPNFKNIPVDKMGPQKNY